MFPVTPTPPETVTAPVRLVVEAVVFVNDVAPVTVPPVNDPPPPLPLLPPALHRPLAANLPSYRTLKTSRLSSRNPYQYFPKSKPICGNNLVDKVS
jgi:hypothetical protein